MVAKHKLLLTVGLTLTLALGALAQDKSVRPGINKPFENPNVQEFIDKFEVESREIYARRQEIVAACRLRPGMVVADVGAGTGLFTRLFAAAVGPQGKVYAIDIAPAFLEHIDKTCRQAGIKNVQAIRCSPTSAELPDNSIDLAFICDTYHHFEFPYKTMASLHRALRPGSTLVLIDFHRIEGKSDKWVLGHVRAGQDVFVREIVTSGFKVLGQESILKDNYFMRFEKKPAPH
jgi:ubiquinone/menaquinone biosynthesis C-methylase UbiE